MALFTQLLKSATWINLTQTVNSPFSLLHNSTLLPPIPNISSEFSSKRRAACLGRFWQIYFLFQPIIVDSNSVKCFSCSSSIFRFSLVPISIFFRSGEVWVWIVFADFFPISIENRQYDRCNSGFSCYIFVLQDLDLSCAVSVGLGFSDIFPANRSKEQVSIKD